MSLPAAGTGEWAFAQSESIPVWSPSQRLCSGGWTCAGKHRILLPKVPLIPRPAERRWVCLISHFTTVYWMIYALLFMSCFIKCLDAILFLNMSNLQNFIGNFLLHVRLGQFASMAGIDQSDLGLLGHPQLSSTERTHVGQENQRNEERRESLAVSRNERHKNIQNLFNKNKETCLVFEWFINYYLKAWSQLIYSCFYSAMMHSIDEKGHRPSISHNQVMFHVQQICILEWFLKDHVMLE